MEQSTPSHVSTTMHRRLAVLSLTAACASSSAPAQPVSTTPSATAASASSVAVVDASVPVNGKARVELATRKSVHFLGENVLVDFCVVNTSAASISIDVGGDYQGSSRSLRFKLEARDEHGTVMPDPDPKPMSFGGMSYEPDIAPGKKWCASLQLGRYARIDAPGTYTVNATHDLGWPAGTAPVGSATVTFAMPDAAQAEHVIATMESLPTDPSTTAGEIARPYADFFALRYEVYVAPLVARANRGVTHALEGLANIPTETATRALVTLLAHGDRSVAHAAARSLAMRLPDPALNGALGKRNPFEDGYEEQRKYLSQSWVPALADDVRAAAKQRLLSPAVDDQQDGAFMLEAVGTPADGAPLVKALDAAIDRTRTVPAEADVYPVPRGACQELLRAADMLVARGLTPSSSPKSPGELALWVVALQHAPVRPAGWESQLGVAMKHPVAYVRQLAMERAPAHAFPPSLVPLVAANLTSADADVVVAAAQLAEREHLTAVTKEVVRAIAVARGIRLNIVSNAAYALGARYERMKVLVSRLSEKAAFDEALSELVGVLDYHGRSTTGEPSDAERAAIAPRWKAFVEQHRTDIESQRKVALSDPSVTKDLLPSGWRLGRGDGSQWP